MVFLQQAQFLPVCCPFWRQAQSYEFLQVFQKILLTARVQNTTPSYKELKSMKRKIIALFFRR